MHKIPCCHFFSAVAVSLLLALPLGCSKSEEPQVKEKGRVEKMTDGAAETAVKKIRTPINKARATQKLGDDRLEEMDKALQKQ